jgi:homoserine kinase
MRARVPGSSANLGPGFDTLALALGVYVEVEIESASSLVIKTEGEGADLPADASHMAARVAREVIGHDRLAINIKSTIPVSRGLGSSAALIVATAAAAGVDDVLQFATRFEGHPENVAASVMGGLVTATMVDDKPVATSLFLDPDLAFVTLVPDQGLSTSAARQALSPTIPREDAVFNLGRLGWLIAALADGDYMVPEVMHDRLHQDERAPLFPEASDLLQALLDAGASAACWSGAGPTLLGIVTHQERAERVRKAGETAMHKLGVPGEAWVLESDSGGLHVE